MSNNKGHFDFTGSFGDFRSYEDPSLEKQITSRKGGPTNKQFWEDPNYALARLRAVEFGGRSTWSSLLKMGLSDIGHLMYVRCFNSIMPIGRLIQQKDPNNGFGIRTISVNNYPEALPMIDFNKRHPFRSLIKVEYEAILSEDKKTVTLTIPQFVTSRDVSWVTKFYAVRIYLAIMQLSDVVWNPVLKGYEPVVKDLETLSRFVISDWMVLNSVPNQISLEASFEEPAFSNPGTSVIVAMGVEFSTTVYMGQPYMTPHNGSVAIVGCFTE